MTTLEGVQIITTTGETATPMRDDSAPDTRPMPAVRRSPVEPDEPTVADAAALVRAVIALGTVGRLDAVHGALLNAYQAGRHAEQRAAEGIAREHAEAFAASIAARRNSQARDAARSWLERRQL